MKLIDLSATLKNGAVNDPPAQRPYITYSDHEAGRDNMLTFLSGRYNGRPAGWTGLGV